MAPVNKAKAAGVNASSFFDLKAELSKQEAEFARNKAAGKSTAIVGGVKRPDKKPTVWARQNKGVGSRASRDIELEAISKPTLDSARAALERKAKIYDKLRKGKTGGLNDSQVDALLVDFDSMPASGAFEADSDDEDESLAVPQAPGEEDDPIIEYEDEFGRLRTAPRSEVPRHLVPKSQDDDDEDIVIHNPVNHFPIYEPSAERIAEVAAAYSEANNPLGVHYDASAEVRAKGAGFYQFSGDEETRRAQMEELKSARKETEKTREEMGATDLKPGEVEGMQEVANGKSRAMEKRKREIEERRRLIEAKRRKVRGVEESPAAIMAPPSTDERKPLQSDAVTSTGPPSDPFATLEADSKDQKRGKRKANGPAVITDADAFLAQLEQEIVGKRT